MKTMTTWIIGAAFLAVTGKAAAQEVLYEAKMDKSQVPDAILKDIERNYPQYAITDYIAQPIDPEEGREILNQEINSGADYGTYKITLKGEGRKLRSEMELEYDRDGQLLNTTEHIRNFAPPEAIRLSIARTYPGWTLEKDAFDMVHYGDGLEKEHYRLTLAKNGKQIKVYTDIEGNLLNNDSNS